MTRLWYACDHDVRGVPLWGDETRNARSVDGPCPRCKRRAEQRAENARREKKRQSRLAGVRRIRKERDAAAEADRQAWLAIRQKENPR
jgi:hypothetical protein